MRWYRLAAGVLLSLTGALAGCSTQSKPVSAPAPAPVVKDGTIVSKKLVHVKDENPDINIYQLMYRSAGVNVEAFVSEPKQSGYYPLLVNLHGGAAGPRGESHITSPVYTAQSLQSASAQMIVIEPEYRGYLDSGGTNQDLLGCTQDAENAIEAAMSVGNVTPRAIYLEGVSLGGGVALMLASQRKDIAAVVCYSPFVGYDASIDWVDEHGDTMGVKEVEPYWASLWGPYKPNAPAYTVRSPIDHIATISAPVLLLQGTGDQNVIWQTVQQFADDMKQQGKTVRLVIYPGGQHGLHDKYQTAAMTETQRWFRQYALY